MKIRGIHSQDSPSTIKLTYLKGHYLRLEYASNGDGDFTECFHKEDITLPGGLHVGFTAHTGQVSDNQDILRVETRLINIKNKYHVGQNMRKQTAIRQNQIKKNRGNALNRSQSASGGFISFLWKVLLAAVILCVAYAAFTIWRISQGRGKGGMLG